MKKPIFIIKEGNQGFHFVFTVPGETSEGHGENYTSKQMCEKGIESVKQNSALTTNYDLKTAKNDKLYFTLRAQNGEIIFTSIMHNNEASRENGILLLKQFAKEAEITFSPYQDND